MTWLLICDLGLFFLVMWVLVRCLKVGFGLGIDLFGDLQIDQLVELVV